MNLRRSLLPGIALMVLLSCSFATASFATATEKWSGVDETVVNKYAAEQGREPRKPLIDTSQGDLLLFVFLLAGAVGGFAAGYYWKTLISGADRKQKPEDDSGKEL